MERFKNISEWADAMIKRGYTPGQDSKGSYYMDRLGFKHRYKQGRDSMIDGNGNSNPYGQYNEIDSVNFYNSPDWWNYKNSQLGTDASNEIGQIPTFNIGDYNIHRHSIDNIVTDSFPVIHSESMFINLKDSPSIFSPIIDWRENFDQRMSTLNEIKKETTECICQRGLTKERFKRYFNIYNDYIFNANNIKYYDIYKTKIDDFLAEFEALLISPYAINNCYRKAHFLAQSWWESDHWQTSEEYKDGTDYENRKSLGNTHIGDGPKFKGRGILQLTGRVNYERYAKFAKLENLMQHPLDDSSKLHLAVDSAGWFWIKGKSINLNILADANDIKTVSKEVNGGKNGAKQREAKTKYLLRVFNAKKCINITNHP